MIEIIYRIISDGNHGQFSEAAYGVLGSKRYLQVFGGLPSFNIDGSLVSAKAKLRPKEISDLESEGFYVTPY